MAGILYGFIYILVSAPGFQRYIAEKIGEELSTLTGGDIGFGSIEITPFTEVVIHDLSAATPEGQRFLDVGTVGAGINLFRLITEGKIEITYVELIDADIKIWQAIKDGPLNIQFLIDAFSSKDQEKPPAAFDLKLRNIVLRKCNLSFDKLWVPATESDKIDFNHIALNNLKADLALPRLSNDYVNVDLRRLSFEIVKGPVVKTISLKCDLSPKELKIKDFLLNFGSTKISPEDIALELVKPFDFIGSIREHGLELILEKNIINPSDLSWVYPGLKNFDDNIDLSLKVKSDLDYIDIDEFKMNDSSDFIAELKGKISSINKINKSSAEVSLFKINIPALITNEVVSAFSAQLPENAKDIIKKLGNIKVEASLESECLEDGGIGNLNLEAEGIEVTVEVQTSSSHSLFTGNADIKIENISSFLSNVPLGNLDLSLNFDEITPLKKPVELIEGNLNLIVNQVEYRDYKLENIELELTKKEKDLAGWLAVDNILGVIETGFSFVLDDKIKTGTVDISLKDINSEIVGLTGKLKNRFLNCNISSEFSGSSIDNLTGSLSLDDFKIFSKGHEELSLSHLEVISNIEENDSREITIDSDWIQSEINGKFAYVDIVPVLKGMLHRVFPLLLPDVVYHEDKNVDLELSALILPENDLPEYLKLPFRLLVPIEISAHINSTDNDMLATVNIPYLQQGKDKLIYDTRLFMDLDAAAEECRFEFNSTMPAKNGEVALALNMAGSGDKLNFDLSWVNPLNNNFKGSLGFETKFTRNLMSKIPDIAVNINPSKLSMGTEDWFISPATLKYDSGILDVRGLKIWHDDQFVEIVGKASKSTEDNIRINLSQIDVDYVFDTLNINYVTFGGTATGEIVGNGVFSKNPVAHTKKLFIKDLSYNGCVVGDGDIESHWNNDEKEVAISAIISRDGKTCVNGAGGVWLASDSLCFDIEGSKVPVEFLQPFMQAFTSHVGGIASGKVRLAGNFHDIDLTGAGYADSIAIKLDYTNTIYHGSDSIYLYPGRIEIPGFKLYDTYGNSALVTGEVTHKYFHEPSFNFKLSEAEDFLCYDTNQSLNPDWYGTVFGSGNAVLRGWPGYVDINIDMTLGSKSVFTFVLNDRLDASDFTFLTFSDKRKEEELKNKKDTIPDFKELFRRNKNSNNDTPTNFDLGIRATVLPGLLFNVIMDPAAGDKISARGDGAIQIEYQSDNDQLLMYGKYIINEGNYNFSLQDLILKDFKIKEGSYISFNGDPLDADLDISAAYRVNTNLSDLDKSFSSDRDLARTNVPVDAILKVTGHMTSPDISFDIELPTLTQDVERKVKSIISTDDMMNRQIIYLLALSRFYTPEYMGSSSNGSEFAGLASTTISSQLANMIGQLTDKFSLAPTFRTDKGDFSDLEVDVALSSRLLNNRLLLNGNFGYRDKSTSSTTFIGDFDIEYLLNNTGNLRLKAYNHFNDQNYYLREALTTQGLGVIYRRDFNNPFRRKKSILTNSEENEDKKEE